VLNSVQSIAEAALQLSPEERRALASRLLDSLEAPSALHPAWHEEIARRLADHRASRTDDTTAEESLAILADYIQERRPASA
jgi:putative addiction module component (TIGR02574 family)